MAVAPERLEEASSAAATFHVAMVLLGAEAMAAVWALWQKVIPTTTRVDASGAEFFNDAYALVAQQRHEAQAIVIPFLRLYRALVTGATYQPVFKDEPEDLSLSDLRDDFAQAVETYAPDALSSGQIHDHSPSDELDQETEVTNPDDSPYKPYRRERWGDDDAVLVDTIEELEKLLDEEEARADAEAQNVIKNLGAELLKEKLAKLEDEELSSQEGDARQEELHRSVGLGVAAHAERMVQNGGRHVLTEVGKADPKVIGFVRVHYPEKDPMPCGFCALLIAKGLEFRPYTSEYSARLEGSDFEKYHPKCHCQVIPVWSEDEYEDARFDVNREMKRLYDEHFVNMTQWRKFMRSRAAQAAAGQE